MCLATEQHGLEKSKLYYILNKSNLNSKHNPGMIEYLYENESSKGSKNSNLDLKLNVEHSYSPRAKLSVI